MKKGLLIVLIGLVVVLGFVVMLIVTGAITLTPQPSTQPQSAPAASPLSESIPKPDLPELTKDERSKAVSLATDNLPVAQLLAGREYDVASVGVWQTSGDPQKIGAGVIPSLAQPAMLETNWPTIDYDRAEVTAPPYQQRTEHYRAENVQRLVVMVDL